MIKNLKLFLIIALAVVHIPHTSHAELDDLGKAAVIGAYALCGATLVTLGSYNLASTPQVTVKTKTFFDINNKVTTAENAPHQTTSISKFPSSHSFMEMFKQGVMCITGAAYLAYAWHLAQNS